MSKLKHEVKESETVIEKTDHWSGEIEGYDVIFDHNENSGARLTIYPVGGHDRLRMGIIECRPDNVESLVTFAGDAERLFTAIAAELREIGKDDLRSKWEVQSESMRAMFTQSVTAR